MENKIWFNEDGDYVWGYKNKFENEEEFIKTANELHKELTGYECILGKVESGVYLLTDEPLEGEYCYRLEDTNIEITTMYCAECSSLEYE